MPHPDPPSVFKTWYFYICILTAHCSKMRMFDVSLQNPDAAQRKSTFAKKMRQSVMILSVPTVSTTILLEFQNRLLYLLA